MARAPLAIGPINRSIEKERRVQVLVRDNNVDQALKVLKKKMQREGIFRETSSPRSAVPEGVLPSHFPPKIADYTILCSNVRTYSRAGLQSSPSRR